MQIFAYFMQINRCKADDTHRNNNNNNNNNNNDNIVISDKSGLAHEYANDTRTSKTVSRAVDNNSQGNPPTLTN